MEGDGNLTKKQIIEEAEAIRRNIQNAPHPSERKRMKERYAELDRLLESKKTTPPPIPRNQDRFTPIISNSKQDHDNEKFLNVPDLPANTNPVHHTGINSDVRNRKRPSNSFLITTLVGFGIFFWIIGWIYSQQLPSINEYKRNPSEYSDKPSNGPAKIASTSVSFPVKDTVLK